MSAFPFHIWRVADEWLNPFTATTASHDYTLIPHKNPKRFTPSEIAAYKHLQKDPNIPEDARPPIPDGYE